MLPSKADSTLLSSKVNGLPMISYTLKILSENKITNYRSADPSTSN